jgi:hypothetical protein
LVDRHEDKIIANQAGNLDAFDSAATIMQTYEVLWEPAAAFNFCSQAS